jgi:FtsH-binding integral membrane protein
MDNLSNFRFSDETIDSSVNVSKSFVTNVFGYMALALALSGVLAYWFAHSGLIENLFSPTGGMSILGYAVMFAPLGFVLVMSFAFNRLSYGALTAIFLSYAAINGISLSTIFLVYSGAAIAKTFFITAGLFAAMAAIGYTTKTDLTKMGSILIMALIGLVIASLVNMFMHSERMDYIISCIGVLIFTGLIAYDTQKIKRIGAGVEYGTATAGKLAIMGALSLYLDFINLFLFLLRIFGRSRD